MSAPASLDWTWAATTAGALTNRQRAQLLTPMLRTVLAYTVTRTRLLLGRHGTGAVQLDELHWPDTQLAREAEAEARATLPPYLLQHSYRTYLFGLALAAIEQLEVDEELGFISSMLHDLDLAEPTVGKCFAVSGSQRAQRFLLDHGADTEAASRIAAAIAGHCTPGADEDLTELAGFVSAGALLDVAGVRYDELDPEWTAAVLDRHPRLALKSQLLPHWAGAAAAMPAGRAQWLTCYAGFPTLIKRAPFSE
jgi:hypothetical protein